MFPRLPFWSYVKLIFTCWLVIPYFSGAAYVYEHYVRPYLVTRQKTVNIWYVPRTKDAFSKPDDILTAAEKYIQENGPEAFEKMINRVCDSFSSQLELSSEILQKLETAFVLKVMLFYTFVCLELCIGLIWFLYLYSLEKPLPGVASTLCMQTTTYTRMTTGTEGWWSEIITFCGCLYIPWFHKENTWPGFVKRIQ